jgi:hypothetical protein
MAAGGVAIVYVPVTAVPPTVYVMVTDPGVRPVKCPRPSIDPIAGLLLDQVPPVVLSVMCNVEPTHIVPDDGSKWLSAHTCVKDAHKKRTNNETYFFI